MAPGDGPASLLCPDAEPQQLQVLVKGRAVFQYSIDAVSGSSDTVLRPLIVPLNPAISTDMCW